jgi:hypothetical protein
MAPSREWVSRKAIKISTADRSEAIFTYYFNLHASFSKLAVDASMF